MLVTTGVVHAWCMMLSRSGFVGSKPPGTVQLSISDVNPWQVSGTYGIYWPYQIKSAG